MTIRPASDRSLLVAFGTAISDEAHRQVSLLCRRLARLRGVLNLHPAFTSVLVDFDPRLRSHDGMEALVRECMDGAAENPAPLDPPRLIEIPVYYGGAGGPDLADVARHCGMDADRVVELHSAAEYVVYFVGFSTCFPYLGGLPDVLATPRLAAPRKHVPEGSVAIGGSQAGVYPLASPGGWRLIGRTDLRLFDASASPPGLLRMDDRVRFRPAEAVR